MFRKETAQGAQQMSELIQCLLADERQEDLARTATDISLRQRLLAEYGIEAMSSLKA